METNPYHAPAVPPHLPVASGSGLVTEGVLRQLAGTKPWVRTLSVFTFIGAGFCVLGAIGMLFLGGLGAVLNASPSQAMPGSGVLMAASAGYLVVALLYIYPGIKLWKYASRIGGLLNSRSAIDLETALNEQRVFWKFAAISLIALIVLYFVAAIGFGIYTSLQPR